MNVIRYRDFRFKILYLYLVMQWNRIFAYKKIVVVVYTVSSAKHVCK